MSLVGVAVVSARFSGTSRIASCGFFTGRTRMNQSSQFMFDGDVIFLWREIAALSVSHHEGGFAHIG